MGIVFELHAYMSLFKRSYDVKSKKFFHHSYASSSFFFRTPLHRFVYFFSHFLVAFLCSMICWSSYTGCGSCTFRVRVCCFSPASNYLHYFYSPSPQPTSSYLSHRVVLLFTENHVTFSFVYTMLLRGAGFLLRYANSIITIVVTLFRVQLLHPVRCKITRPGRSQGSLLPKI